jgi:alpha-glucosidase (family GH31 glycosyl hydrolase)
MGTSRCQQQEVLYDMHFADGSTGRSMHNRYLVLYMRATREEITAYDRAYPRRTLLYFNRAGFSGLPGSADYEGGTSPGDEATDFGQAAGLASSAPDMLSRAIGGAFGFATDIGG